MTGTDLYGLDVSIDSAQAIGNWDATMQAFMAHGASTPDHLGAVLSEDPEFALALACKGMFCLLLGRRELVKTAWDVWKTADVAKRGGACNPREAVYVDALKVWLDGYPGRAAHMLDTLIQSYPNDALALKLVHAIRFILGDAAGMRTSLEHVIDGYDPSHPAAGYVRGCYAFALEETGDLEKAEAVGRSGLDLAPDDAWGMHAVAHVFEMQARTQTGIDWLSGSCQAWENCNNFRYHFWWHLALFHLANGDHEHVLALYDAEIRKDQTDDYRDISNGSSLLTRLEIEGVDVGDRWEELADLSEERTDDGCVVFADLHYLLSLMGGNRHQAISDLLSRMGTMAETGKGDMADITIDPGLSAATGLEDFRCGRYELAYRRLIAARPSMPTIGGSHAQRDVFEWVTVEAALRSGLWHDARRLLEDRIERRGAVDGFAKTRLKLIEELVNPNGLTVQEPQIDDLAEPQKRAAG